MPIIIKAGQLRTARQFVMSSARIMDKQGFPVPQGQLKIARQFIAGTESRMIYGISCCHPRCNSNAVGEAVRKCLPAVHRSIGCSEISYPWVHGISGRRNVRSCVPAENRRFSEKTSLLRIHRERFRAGWQNT